MCCRYYIEKTMELDPIIEEMNRSPLLNRFPAKWKVVSQGEARPTNIVPVVATNRRGTRSVFPMKWGYEGKPLLINARTETAAVRPTFRDSWTSHRCAIPASWYFEWEHLVTPEGKQKTGDKYALRPAREKITWLCGLYRLEEGLPNFVVLTRDPAQQIRFIHDRMPLMLPGSLVDEWIHPDATPEKLLDSALMDISFQKADGQQRVDELLNDFRYVAHEKM